jgi:DNA-directed RNA polymerase I subunit RPA49
MDFLGREAEDDADSQLKHYIAVVDPEKKTWEFVEARKVTLRSGVRNAQHDDEEEEEEEEEEEDAAAVCYHVLHVRLQWLMV